MKICPSREDIVNYRVETPSVMVLLALMISFSVCSTVRGQHLGSDKLIVPGQRIGPVRLGMTTAELYRAMGDPTKMYEYTNEVGQHCEYPGLAVDVKRGRVYTVTALSAEFSTVEGVRVGDSQLAMEAKLGSPIKKTMWAQPAAAPEWGFWYGRGKGMEIRINAGVIRYIEVWPP
jgi:hypothetical protein